MLLIFYRRQSLIWIFHVILIELNLCLFKFYGAGIPSSLVFIQVHDASEADRVVDLGLYLVDVITLCLQFLNFLFVPIAGNLCALLFLFLELFKYLLLRFSDMEISTVQF